MNLSKFIRGLGIVTILSLIYIHLQIQIYELAYKGKDKEKEMLAISENNAVMTYDVLELKSANHLGVRLLQEDAELCFLDHQNVVRLVTADPLVQEQVNTPVPMHTTNPLLSLLSVRAEAQANTIQRNNLFQKLRKSP